MSWEKWIGDHDGLVRGTAIVVGIGILLGLAAGCYYFCKDTNQGAEVDRRMKAEAGRNGAEVWKR
jgi:hypothetical protein